MKKFVEYIDRTFFNNLIRSFYRYLLKIKDKKREFSSLKSLHKQHEYSFDIIYSKNYSCTLTKLADFYGSDKGEISSTGNPYNWQSHSYTDYYSLLFDHCRTKFKRVLECGIGTKNLSFESNMGASASPGASLRMWRDYFSSAEIIGIDLDESCLFTEERITTYQVDQTSANSISNFFKTIENNPLEIIIDDGLHQFDAGICLFENSIKYLTTNGIYFIEDIKSEDLSRYQEYFSHRKNDFNVKFVTCHRPNSRLLDNSILTITKCLI